jgi:hypothetical protein
VIELMSEEDFYRETHRKIFRSMVALSERNEPIDLITLTDTLKAIDTETRSALQQAHPQGTFFDFYWITAVVVSLSILTPGQVGEGLKIELMKRRGLVGRLPGLGAFALERVLDLLAVVGMGATGLVFSGLAKRYRGVGTGAAILIILGLISLYILLLFNPQGRPSHWLARMRTGSGSPATWAVMGILTVCSWAAVGVSTLADDY